MHGSRRRTVRLLPAFIALIAGMAVASPAAAAERVTADQAPPARGLEGMNAQLTAVDGVSPEVSAAAAPGHDLPGAAIFLPHDTRFINVFTTDATVNGEPTMTCNTTAGALTLTNTVWYRFKGNGGRVVLNTGGSSFDTLLFVFSGSTATPGNEVICADDQPHNPGDDPNVWRDAVAVVPNTVAGRDYLVAFGGCTGCAQPSGELRFSYVGSDDRARPGALTRGSSAASTFGASNETGENRSCSGVTFGSTAWYRINLTEPGTLTFSPVGVDFRPVVSLYPAGSTTRLGCVVGANAVPSTPRFTSYLRRGSYDVQVGGVNGLWGYFPYTYSFVVDPDEDNDTWNRAPYNGSRRADCNDGVSGGAIHPGAWDKRDGGDNDCDGFKDEEVDHDGYDAEWANGTDCKPDNIAISPKAKEKKGNKVDENCDGKKEDWPELKVNVGPAFGRSTGSSVWHFNSLPIKNIPKGARLKVSCKGGGCPGGSFKKDFRRRTSTYTGALSFARRISMGSGTIVEFRITAPRKQGKVIQFWLARVGGKVQPVRRFEKCLRYGSRKATKCR
jgi:Putative metal-binding motif